MKPPKKKSNTVGWVSMAVELIKQGLSVPYVTEHIAELMHGKVNYEKIAGIINEAEKLIAADCELKAASIKSLHIRRYDNRITRLLKTKERDIGDIADEGDLEVGDNGLIRQKRGITYQQWKNNRNRKIKAFNDAVDTMILKENLLQICTNSYKVEIDEQITIEKKTKESNFNADLLTFEEALELYNLMEFCNLDGKNVQSVMEVTTEKQITEDVVAEILPANVELIKQEAPLPVVDDNPNTTAKMKLVENMRKLAVKKLKDAGANLDAGELKYLDQN